MRLFVGLALPVDIRTCLGSVQAGLAGARWIDPENLHLTLRFVGDVSGPDADDLDSALRDIDAAAFEMELKGVGHWDRRGKVHSLWVGVERNDALNHLQSKVESAVVRTGHGPEGRKFVPHVTVARLKGTPLKRIGTWMEQWGTFASEPFTVDRFVLFRSHLGSSGAQYERLAEYPLVDYESMASASYS